MVFTALTYSLVGIEALPVSVECDISFGMPAFTIVGLPENTVKESKERIRSAVKNAKFGFPEHRITVNLAPADLRKDGTSFDLPIALALAAKDAGIHADRLMRFLVAGELSLNGELRPTKGALSAAFLSKRLNLDGIILPKDNATEAAAFTDLPCYGMAHLVDVIAFLKGVGSFAPAAAAQAVDEDPGAVDFSDVIGQQHAKRAFEIAAAGRHNIIMTGPPGAGKTMLAQRMGTILPPLTRDESLESSLIYSCAGLLDPSRPVITARPFRSPHHTASEAAVVGGGSVPRPGEISLAHHGVLFLDEFPEFKRPVIEALRQPLEEGVVHVSRAAMSTVFPANFLLVAAMNPCPCGKHGDDSGSCACTPASIARYRGRISGPILDRIDIHIELPRLPVRDLGTNAPAERSADIRARVAAAHGTQHRRYGRQTTFNGRLSPKDIKNFCAVDESSRTLLLAAMERYRFSTRSYNKILKLGRTIADLDGSPSIESHHLAEAIHLRGIDTVTS